MRKTFAAIAVLLANTLLTQFAAAETTRYGSFTHRLEIPKTLFLLGEIKPGDSFELRRAMRDYEIELVVTASPGGNLYEGLQISSILHDKGVNTYIPEGASCESSCAMIFLGGRHRMALGEIGVHQFFSGSENADANARQDVTTASTQYTTSDIIGILNEFDTPPFVYEKMFGTNEMHYFRSVNKLRLSRGGEDEKFLDQMSKVDEFVATAPGALKRPAQQPASTTMARTTPETHSTPIPKSEPKLPERFDDVDFFGMDLSPSGIRDVSLYQCERYCKNNTACAAYSYVTATRWCWPKSGVDNLSIANGVISGITDYSRVNQEVFERPYRETTAVDIPGYDLYPKGLKNMTLDQCRHACQATSGCVAFSWVAKKSWCFPKHGYGQLNESLGIISGIRN